MKHGNPKFRRNTGRKPKTKTVNRLFPTLAKIALCFQTLVTVDSVSLVESTVANEKKLERALAPATGSAIS